MFIAIAPGTSSSGSIGPRRACLTPDSNTCSDTSL
jgi:hypothetical protein